MILGRAKSACIASVIVAGAFSHATGARADVMEIDGDGARWVAGALVAAPVAGSQAEAALIEASGPEFGTPDGILANVVANASGVPAPYAAKIQELSHRFDLSPSLLEALVWQESRWRSNAVSHAGARGLAQLMPGTARYLGVNPDDPMQNLEGGARYLREQLDRFDGDIEKALAAYNAGPGRVIKAGGVPNIRETRQYVAAIMGRLANRSRPAAAQ